jgi:PI-3-kinase-related kinase SMG-1
LQDKGWISPPDSICSSISEYGFSPAEENVPDCLIDLSEEIGQLSHGSTGYQNSAPFSQTNFQELSRFVHSESKYVEVNVIDTGSVKSTMNEPIEFLEVVTAPSNESVTAPADSLHSANKNSDEKFGGNDEIFSLNKAKIEDEDRDAPLPNTHGEGRVSRGKYQAYIYHLFSCIIIVIIFIGWGALSFLNQIYLVWKTKQGLVF